MAKLIRDLLNDDKKLTEIVKVAFDSVDTDRSGQIDANELETLMINMADDMGTERPTKEEVIEILEDLDPDGSGQIDFKEFKGLMRGILEDILES